MKTVPSLPSTMPRFDSTARRPARATGAFWAVALQALALAACGGPPPAGSPSTAASAPLRTGVAFELPSDGGQLVPIPQPSARVTVIDAFGPTCGPCREKLPALLARKADIEAAGGKLVLVAVLGDGESTADAAAALQSWGVSSPFLVDRGGVLLRELGLSGLPDAFVIDQAGAVRWQGGATAKAEDVVAAASR